MKKELKGFLLGVLITSIVSAGIPIFAANAPKTAGFAVNAVKIAFNGKTIPLDNISYNGSTYVKLSQICTIFFGSDISWDGKTKTVNIANATSSSSSVSAEVAMPTQAVNTKPEVVAVKLPDTSGIIEIIFNQMVDKACVENTSNYSFGFTNSTPSAISILSISMDPTETKVAIQTKDALPEAFDFTISNIKNKAGLSMDPYTIKLKR